MLVYNHSKIGLVSIGLKVVPLNYTVQFREELEEEQLRSTTTHWKFVRKFCEVLDSILRPLDYKSDALPIELTSQPIGE